jgi:serine/threonine protein kinase
LARFFADTTDHLTQQLGGHSLIGTADFLSPEQAVDSQSADARSDIYSLGATLYYMLVGHAPFQSATVAEKLLQHQSERPKAIRDQRSEVPAALAAVVDRAMAKNPQDRFPNCLELIDALMPFVPAVVPLPLAEEMPKLCPAARATDAQSSRLTLPPPKSSLRMARPSLTPPHGQAHPSTINMTDTTPHRAWRRTVIAASICAGGLLIGVVMGKLASPASAQTTSIANHHDEYEEK